MAKRRGKTSAKAPVAPATPPEIGSLVPQEHGGALRYGGTNAGGPGRPPSALRATCRASFAARIKILEDIADGEPIVKLRGPDGETTIGLGSASPADRIRAIDTLGKYGGIEKLTLDDGSGRDRALSQLSDEDLIKVLYARAGRLKRDRERHQALLRAGADLDALGKPA